MSWTEVEKKIIKDRKVAVMVCVVRRYDTLLQYVKSTAAYVAVYFICVGAWEMMTDRVECNVICWTFQVWSGSI